MIDLIAKYKALLKRQQDVERQLNGLWEQAQPLTGELAQLRHEIETTLQELAAVSEKEHSATK